MARQWRGGGSGKKLETCMENVKPKSLISYALGRGRAAGRSSPDFLFCAGERFMPPLQDFRSGKGVWLGSYQNQAKMSGGVDKTDYERFSSCVAEQSSMMQLISDYDMHVVGVVSF